MPRNEFTKLIKAFIENPKKLKETLQQIAVYTKLEQTVNIVHMIFNDKKCLVFVRQHDGALVVYLCHETLLKESFRDQKQCCDL